jgi:WD40 repeat protein
VPRPRYALIKYAKRVQGEVHHTRTGGIVGTPSYMPPEQARAEKVLTTSVDVYSVGAVLYELLTGRPPFRADSPLDTLMDVLEKEPARPRSLNPLVDRDLETVALKCLSKEPAQRYGSAEELAADLERWLRGEPIRARRVGIVRRVAKWARRRPAVAGLLAALALLAVGAFVGMLYLWLQARDNLFQANARQQALRSNLYDTRTNLAQTAWHDAQVGRVLELLEAQRPGPGEEDLRGFDWNYLWRLCHRARLHLYRGDPLNSSVDDAAFSPDGRLLAVAFSDPGPVILFDADSGKPLWTQSANSLFGPQRLTFTPDGRQLLCFTMPAPGFPDKAGFTWRLAVRDVNSGEEIRSLRRPLQSAGFVDARFHPDGRRLVIANGDGLGSLQLFDVGGAELHRLQDGNTKAGRISGLGFSRDGRRLAARGEGATVSDPTVVSVWNVADGLRLCTLPLLNRSTDVALGPDGLSVIATDGALLKRWDVATGRLQLTFQGLTRAVAMACNHDGKQLATFEDNGTVRLWDVATGQPLGRLQGYQGGVRIKTHFTGQAIFRPGRAELIVFGGGGAMAWDTTRLADEWRIPVPGGVGLSAAFTSDGRLVVVGVETPISPPGKRLPLQAYELEPGPPFTARVLGKPLTVPEDLWWRSSGWVRVSPDGRLATLVSLMPHNNYQIRVWDVRGGKPLAELVISDGYVGPNEPALAFSPDGKCLATAGREHIRIWDTATGQARHVLTGRADMVITCLAYSPDGQLLFSADENLKAAGEGQVKVWATANGEEVRSFRLPAGAGPVTALAASPDSRRLAVARDRSSRISVLDAVSGAELLALEGSRFPVVRIAFSPDGRRLTARGKLWDATTGLELLTLGGDGNECVGFSPDGGTIAALFGREVGIWDGRPPDSK